jgi:hypothetical protein
MDKKEILDLICLSTMLPDPVKGENQTIHKFSQVGVDVDLLLLIDIKYKILILPTIICVGRMPILYKLSGFG